MLIFNAKAAKFGAKGAEYVYDEVLIEDQMVKLCEHCACLPEGRFNIRRVRFKTSDFKVFTEFTTFRFLNSATYWKNSKRNWLFTSKGSRS